MRIRRASTEEGDPLLWWGRIHFVWWFIFKSVGTNLWHEVILCWSFSPKFIHQLFTVNADCISVGNYKGWVFSLRQKECDTAEPTPDLMCRSRCPSHIREGRIIYVLETVCSGNRKKKQTHYFKPFITCINISTEINKGCWACLEDSCSLLRLACLERVGALGMPSIPAPSKTPPSLFNHPLRAGGTAGAVKVSSFHGRGWICCKNWGAIDGRRRTKMSVAFELEVSFFEAVMLQIKWSFLLKIPPAEEKKETTQDYKYSSN